MQTVEETNTSPFLIAWTEDADSMPWREIVATALAALGGQAVLPRLYKAVENHPRTKRNPHWREQIGYVLGKSPEFVRIAKGTWALSNHYTKDQVDEFNRVRREECPKLGPRKKES